SDLTGGEAGEARAVSNEIVEGLGRDQLRARAGVQVDELREVELNSALVCVAPDLLDGLDERTITPARRRADGACLHPKGARCVCSVTFERLLQAYELHSDLDHQPVVRPQVETAQLGDAAQPLAERVGVDEERFRGGADVAA